MEYITARQAVNRLKKMGFHFLKIKPGTTYVEFLDDEIFQWTDKNVIGIAKSYDEDK
jgi:hypothetical protein